MTRIDGLSRPCPISSERCANPVCNDIENPYNYEYPPCCQRRDELSSELQYAFSRKNKSRGFLSRELQRVDDLAEIVSETLNLNIDTLRKNILKGFRNR